MKKIYAIPGLATTKELFAKLKLNNAELVVLEWPTIDKGESLQEYAKKFLKQIDTSQPFILMGVSFGGMLCSEISLLTQPEKTIIISSCKCAKELPLSLKVFSKFPIYRALSDHKLKSMAYRLRYFLGFEKTYDPVFKSMLFSMKKDYLKYSIDCILKWKNNHCQRKDLIHIHGDADKLLFYKNVKADYTIKDGTHGMIVNDADEISQLLNSLL